MMRSSFHYWEDIEMADTQLSEIITELKNIRVALTAITMHTEPRGPCKEQVEESLLKLAELLPEPVVPKYSSDLILLPFLGETS